MLLRHPPKGVGPSPLMPRRFTETGVGDTSTVRLTRKLAARLDGIDLSNRQVGDVLRLPRHDARLLVAEGWAEPAPDETIVHPKPRRPRR